MLERSVSGQRGVERWPQRPRALLSTPRDPSLGSITYKSLTDRKASGRRNNRQTAAGPDGFRSSYQTPLIRTESEPREGFPKGERSRSVLDGAHHREQLFGLVDLRRSDLGRVGSDQ